MKEMGKKGGDNYFFHPIGCYPMKEKVRTQKKRREGEKWCCFVDYFICSYSHPLRRRTSAKGKGGAALPRLIALRIAPLASRVSAVAKKKKEEKGKKKPVDILLLFLHLFLYASSWTRAHGEEKKRKKRNENGGAAQPLRSTSSTSNSLRWKIWKKKGKRTSQG